MRITEQAIQKSLKRALQLMKKGWTTGSLRRVRGSWGLGDFEPSPFYEGKDLVYCALGAIIQAVHEMTGVPFSEIFEVVNREHNDLRDAIEYWNDSFLKDQSFYRPPQEVVTAFQKAIRSCR